MKALVTGVGGFVGRHLVNHLMTLESFEVTGTTFLHPDDYTGLPDIQLVQINLTDSAAVKKLLEATRPQEIYHLAAQSFVPESFESPWETLSNNIHSQLNLLHAMLKLDLDARILVVGTGEVYGAVSPDDVPIDENQPLRPPSPYSVSKVTQDMLGLQYYLSHDVEVIRVRPFNQIGPGQSKRFVAPAFASQIAAIEVDKQDPVVHVGNLDARRDFTDVRDMVRAYRLVMALGEPGAVYNIGSGKAHSIQELLNILLYLSEASITVKQDPARMRPVEVPIIVCDPTKVHVTTGWEPRYTFEETLQDVLNDWRQKT